MSGEFVYEDRSGRIIIASRPGMDDNLDSKKSATKSKSSEKKGYTRPLIKIFSDLSDDEIDELWKSRFEKMATSRFPAKISWNPSKEDPKIYGELIYKHRLSTESLPIPTDMNISDIREQIKSFILNYTNIGTELDNDEDDIQIIDKTHITPIPWNKLSAKDQSQYIEDYLKEFGLENGISKQDLESLTTKVILYAMGKNIQPFIEFDDSGKITKIRNVIYRDQNGVFKVKNSNL